MNTFYLNNYFMTGYHFLTAFAWGTGLIFHFWQPPVIPKNMPPHASSLIDRFIFFLQFHDVVHIVAIHLVHVVASAYAYLFNGLIFIYQIYSYIWFLTYFGFQTNPLSFFFCRNCWSASECKRSHEQQEEGVRTKKNRNVKRTKISAVPSKLAPF